MPFSSNGGGGGSGAAVADYELKPFLYRVIGAGAWGAVGDIVQYVQVFDPGTSATVPTSTYYYNLNTQTIVTPGLGNLAPLDDSEIPITTRYYATAAGVGYSIGDIVTFTMIVNKFGVASNGFWWNVTTGSLLAAAPSSTNILAEVRVAAPVLSRVVGNFATTDPSGTVFNFNVPIGCREAVFYNMTGVDLLVNLGAFGSFLMPAGGTSFSLSNGDFSNIKFPSFAPLAVLAATATTQQLMTGNPAPNLTPRFIANFKAWA
jgi:hypothetical protein